MAGLTVIRMPPLATARGVEAKVRLAVRRALQEIGKLAVSEVRKAIAESRDSRGFKGRIDTGLLVNAITAGTPIVGRTRATQRTFVQGAPAKYAPAIESGRGAGKKLPPVAKIEGWLRRTSKGRALVQRRQAELRKEGRRRPAHAVRKELAFLVARKMARVGTPGIGMFAQAKKAMARQAPAVLRRHVARAA